MSVRYNSNWLENVLITAQKERWCTRTYCTTCGSFVFRHAYWAEAARKAGVSVKAADGVQSPKKLLAGVSDTERELIVRALVAGLRDLSKQWVDSEAFRTIIADLDRPLLTHGVDVDLSAELIGTPADDELSMMRTFEAARRDERVRREVEESPSAAAERKRAKKEAKSQAHAIRQLKTQQKNAERKSLLADLAGQPIVERLSRLARDSTINIDWVSDELIQIKQSDLVNLGLEEAVALSRRIDRRKGAWGKLRRMIDQKLENWS